MTILVFDSAPLSCFARARQLSMLERLTAGDDRVTTHAVLDEIRNGIAVYPDLQGVLQLPWLRVVSGEGLAELKLFAWYAQRRGLATTTSAKPRCWPGPKRTARRPSPMTRPPTRQAGSRACFRCGHSPSCAEACGPGSSPGQRPRTSSASCTPRISAQAPPPHRTFACAAGTGGFRPAAMLPRGATPYGIAPLDTLRALRLLFWPLEILVSYSHA